MMRSPAFYRSSNHLRQLKSNSIRNSNNLPNSNWRQKLQFCKYCFLLVVNSAIFQVLFYFSVSKVRFSTYWLCYCLSVVLFLVLLMIAQTITCVSSHSFLVFAGIEKKTIAEIKLRTFFCNNNNLRGCAGVSATGGTRRLHHFLHVKKTLLPPDFKYIKWAPVFLVVSCHDLLCQGWVTCTRFLQKPKN